MIIRKILFICLVIVYSLSTAGCVDKKSRSDIYLPNFSNDHNIPDGYKTYTLMLTPSYSLIKNYSKDEIRNIYTSFKSFGDSIGNDNAAVTFVNPDGFSPSVENSRYIVDIINNNLTTDKLEYDNSFIVVFMNYNPEFIENKNNNYITYISFDKTNVHDVEIFLDKLAQLVRTEKMHPYSLEIKQVMIWLNHLINKAKVETEIEGKLYDFLKIKIKVNFNNDYNETLINK